MTTPLFVLIALITFAAIATFIALWFRNRPRLERVSGETIPLIPDSRFIEVDGAKIHYVQAGIGRDVVLVHGIGASLYIWRLLFPLLQTRYRVTALDLPGFGQSCKEPSRDYGLDSQTRIVARALEELKIGAPLVVGSSMGGAIALWLGKLYPDRFRKIAVLSPATDSRLVPIPFHTLSAAAPFFRKALNRKTMKLILTRVLARHDRITDDVVDAYLSPFLDGEGHALRAFTAATSLLADKRLPSELSSVPSRVLVIYGKRDLMVPRRTIDGLMKILPNASLAHHDRGGHHIMEDEPEWLAEQLEIFFEESNLQ